MADSTRLVVYHRSGCHLCDDLLERLYMLQTDWKFFIEIRDVDSDAELERCYGDKVPVVEIDDNEVCRYFLDEPRLLSYLRTA